jgi:hypothetical protein
VTPVRAGQINTFQETSQSVHPEEFNTTGADGFKEILLFLHQFTALFLVVPCSRYLLSLQNTPLYWLHSFYLRLHESLLQSFLYTEYRPPDVLSRGGLLMSSRLEGWLLTDFSLSLVACRLFATGSVTNLTLDSSYSLTICDCSYSLPRK